MNSKEQHFWIGQVRTYGRLIKFSHTVFALPFALAAVLLAHQQHPIAISTLFWIIVAMAGARSAAMGFNRYADLSFDGANPRTATRPSITGEISKGSVLVFVALSSSVFVLSAAMLGKLCMVFSMPVLCVLFGYSYAKRFTSYSHLFLGFAIGLAPIGSWIAATGALDWRITLLSLALMTYIAGFDILYACQDVEFDRSVGLFSIPARRGVEKALQISNALHGLTFFFLLALYFAFGLGKAYLAGLLLIGLLLVVEHKLVRPDQLDRINLAFFHVNSVISVLLFIAVLVDRWGHL